MSTPIKNSWSDAERQMLDGILDRLIPGSADGRVPAAGTLGVADFLDATVAKDAGLAKLFRQGLSRASKLAAEIGDRRDASAFETITELLERHEPGFFVALLRQTYMGYYSRADVRPLFGLSLRPTQPDGYSVPPEAAEDIAALVAPVTARGPCYRSVPIEGGVGDGQ